MTGRITRASPLGVQADSKIPSSSKEPVQKVGPPARGTPRQQSGVITLPKESPATKTKFKQVEVVLPIRKNGLAKSKEQSTKEERPAERREAPKAASVTSGDDLDEELLREIAELQGDTPEIQPKPKQRPFDSVKPHDVEPMPINLPLPEETVKASPVKDPFASESGPKYQIRNGFSRSGIDENVAKKLFNAEVTLTSEELLALSPNLQKILARKARNVRVAPTKRKAAYISTLLEDGTEIPEGPVDTQLASYILLDDISLQDKEVFEILEEDQGEIRAGSVVQRDPVEAFKADLPEGDERKNLVIVAGRSSSLRCIKTRVNNHEEMTEAILDIGCQIVAIDQQVAVDLDIVWDPSVTIRLQDVHGGLEETAGLARNVPFLIGDITMYLQLHVQKAAPFEILIGRPFDVLTESVIKNHSNGNQEVTITDPNTGHRCTMGTYVRSNRRRLRFDGADSNPRLVPEVPAHVKEEAEGNFSASTI